MSNLEELRVVITAETKKLKKSLDDAAKQIQKFSSKSEGALEDLDGEFDSLGTDVDSNMARATADVEDFASRGRAAIGRLDADFDSLGVDGVETAMSRAAASVSDFVSDARADLSRLEGAMDIDASGIASAMDRAAGEVAEFVSDARADMARLEGAMDIDTSGISSAMGRAAADVADFASDARADIARVDAAFDSLGAEGIASAMARARSEVSNFVSSARSDLSKLEGDFKTIGDSAREGMAVAAGALAGVSAVIIGTSNGTVEQSKRLAQLGIVAQNTGIDFDVLTDTYIGLQSILQDEGAATTAMQLLAQLTQNEQELAEWTTIVAGAQALLGEELNAEELIGSINETAKLGVVTGQFADALNKANISAEQVAASMSGNEDAQKAFNKAIAEGLPIEDAYTEALKACSDAGEREALMRAYMNDVYGEAGTQYQKATESIRKQAEASHNLQTGLSLIGDTMRPLLTTLTQFGAEILHMTAGILRHTMANVDLQSALESLRPVIEVIATALAKVLVFVAENIDTIVKLGVAVVAAAAAFKVIGTAIGLVQGAISAFKIAMGAASAAADAFAGAQMIISVAGGPAIAAILGIVAAVAAVVAIVIYCYNEFEGFRNMINSFVETVITRISELVSVVVTQFTGIVEAVKGLVSAIVNSLVEAYNSGDARLNAFVEIFKSAFNTIKAVVETALEIVTAVVEYALTFIREIIETVTAVIEGDWEAVWQNIKDIFKAQWDLITSILSSLLDGIAQIITNKLQAAKNIVSNVLGNIASLFGGNFEKVKSTVSNAFSNINSTFTSKLNAAKSTVTSIFTNIVSAVSSKMEAAKTTVSNAVNKLKSFFNFSWELPKIKLPHFNITGSFSLNPPSIPKFSVSWYQQGGVFDSPTLFGFGNGSIGGLGERGAEMVAPLENNLGWLNKLADMLSERMSGNQDVILQVDGTTLGRVTAAGINGITSQTGVCPIRVF